MRIIRKSINVHGLIQGPAGERGMLALNREQWGFEGRQVKDRRAAEVWRWFSQTHNKPTSLT